MNGRKRIAALAGAGALLLALSGTALAADATPVGHYASTGGDGSNDGGFWVTYLNANFDAGLEEGDCDTKLEGSALAAVNKGDGSADLGAAYGWVIVKQGSPNPGIVYDNTIFEDVTASQTVFADTNGNFVHDEADSGGISHIIVCVPGEEETQPPTAPPTETPFQSVFEETDAPTDAPTETPFQSVEGDTDEPSEPDTATIGGSRDVGSPADGAWLLVVVLGVLLSSIVVLTPARAKAPRR
jgi:hypothetical protein